MEPDNTRSTSLHSPVQHHPATRFDRLTVKQVCRESVLDMADLRHPYRLALEEIADTLAQYAIAITGQKRGDMLALAARMNLEGDLVPTRWPLARRQATTSAAHGDRRLR